MKVLSSVMIILFMMCTMSIAQNDQEYKEEIKEIQKELHEVEKELAELHNNMEQKNLEYNKKLLEKQREYLKVLMKQEKLLRKRMKHLMDEHKVRLDSLKEEMDRVSIEMNDSLLSFHFPRKKREKKEGLPVVRLDALMLDLGWNAYLYKDKLNLPGRYSFLEMNLGRSINVQFYPAKLGVSLIRHKLNLMSGLGIEYNNYFLINKIELKPYSNTLEYNEISGRPKKYKLSSHYIILPLELQYATNARNRKKSFRIGAGGKIGYRFKTYTKKIDRQGEKRKIFDDFNVNPVRYGLSGHIGYGVLNLYANYYLSSMFTEGKGPGLTPISFGITLNGFEWN